MATLVAATAILGSSGCGSSPASSPAGAQAPAAGPPATPAESAAPVITLLEPVSGFSAGHIDTFTWKPVEGADGYRLDLTAATDGRPVWQSPVVAATEVRLPSTVGLEPEAYVWRVTALRGTTVLAVSAPGRFFVTP